MSYHSELDATIHDAACQIADEIINAARNSGNDPIAWVTGNSYMPPLRSFDMAENVWKMDANDDGELFACLVELVEKYLSDANVALECPEYDNALYAVDLNRFEYSDNAVDVSAEVSETLQDNWQPIS